MNAALESYFSRESTLTPPLKNWEEDLPKSVETQHTAPRLTYINEINNVWMEVPLHEDILWCAAPFTFILTTIGVFLFLAIGLDIIISGIPSYSIPFIMFIGSFICLTASLFDLKLIAYTPRPLPIRFNRALQKVYVYQHTRRWNPWVRWPTTIKVYNWADIHGELSYQSGRYDQGYQLWCAVCQPGTRQVIDRFMLSDAIGHPKVQRGLWSHCCHYMAHRPVPIRPLYKTQPRTWKLRETVRWPADIDHESRTAPQDEMAATSGARDETR
ncbi:hypothetical protein C1N62_20420 (plasmid) [Nissabacter sp. SGAir0207]|nr:hypothetical protein C1N62_20420 [Nissabacter sp. SGAir0207]